MLNHIINLTSGYKASGQNPSSSASTFDISSGNHSDSELFSNAGGNIGGPTLGGQAGSGSGLSHLD